MPKTTVNQKRGRSDLFNRRPEHRASNRLLHPGGGKRTKTTRKEKKLFENKDLEERSENSWDRQTKDNRVNWESCLKYRKIRPIRGDGLETQKGRRKRPYGRNAVRNHAERAVPS